MLSKTASSQNTSAGSTASTAASPLLQTSAAMLFGLVVLFAVGFLPTAAAHNAAHDTRHALAFPCH